MHGFANYPQCLTWACKEGAVDCHAYLTPSSNHDETTEPVWMWHSFQLGVWTASARVFWTARSMPTLSAPHQTHIINHITCVARLCLVQAACFDCGFAHGKSPPVFDELWRVTLPVIHHSCDMQMSSPLCNAFPLVLRAVGLGCLMLCSWRA